MVKENSLKCSRSSLFTCSYVYLYQTCNGGIYGQKTHTYSITHYQLRSGAFYRTMHCMRDLEMAINASHDPSFLVQRDTMNQRMLYHA